MNQMEESQRDSKKQKGIPEAHFVRISQKELFFFESGPDGVHRPKLS